MSKKEETEDLQENNAKTFFSKDIQQINEVIKDYLKNQEFENTMECFNHELKTKIINKKLTNITVDISDAATPEIFKQIKGESNKSQDEKKKDKVNSETTKRYLDLLTGSRQIFSASVALLKACTENEEVMQDKKLNQLTGSLKLELGKYHSLILPEFKINENIEVKDLKSFKKIKETMLKLESETNKGNELIEEMIKLRTHSLSISSSSRAKFITNFINADMLNINKNTGMLETQLKNSLIRGQTVGLALISSLCGLPIGVEYIFKKKEVYETIRDVILELERDSVSYRFGIAVFQKASYLKKYSKTLYQDKILDWAKDGFKRYKLKEHSPFQAMYLASLMHNLIVGESVQSFHKKNINGLSKTLIVVLDSIKKGMIPGEAIMILLSIIDFLVKNGEYYNECLQEANIEDELNKINLPDYFQERTHINESLQDSINTKFEEVKIAFIEYEKKMRDMPIDGKRGTKKQGNDEKETDNNLAYRIPKQITREIIFESFKDELI